jgi:uncharacterized SAM-binding protein YcdF (DUF218 family)
MLWATWKVARRRPGALAPALAGVAILWLFSTEVVADALWSVTERGVRSTMRAGVEYDAVVLLGGMVDEEATAASGAPAYNDSIERLLSTRELLATGRAKNVLITGGSVSSSGVVEARLLSDELVRMGIARERIVTEEASRNTRENALFSRKIVDERGFHSLILVTSAFHMPRALGCFRKVGLAPDVLPVDYRAYPLGRALGVFPRSGELMISAGALRELFGRLVYRLRGYSE